MIINENYAFWELMTEKSYLSSNSLINSGTLQRFESEDSYKSVYVFGSNNAAVEFIEQNITTLKISGILDNAPGKWGTEVAGIKVYEPAVVIPKLDPDNDVIIISLKLATDSVSEQIVSMGFKNIYSLSVLISQSKPYDEWIRSMADYERRPLEDLILFESTNDFDGNAFAVYEYLKKNHYSHKTAWVIKNPLNKKYAIDECDEVVCPKDNFNDLKRFVELRAVAKWQIWDNSPIRKVRDGQINVFLQHFGMGYKQTSSFYQTPDYVDYILSPNEFVRKMQQSSLLYPEGSNFIFGELPRNDVLAQKWNELEKLTERNYSKAIIWMPTIRELDTNGRKDAEGDYPYGVSLIYTEEDMNRFNEQLKARDILMVIKPHPRQKLNYKCDCYSNVIYVSGEKNKEINGYKLLTQMDGLITDYSSVVFDYMLLDRPVAFVLEDKYRFSLEYKMDDPDYFMPGQKIYTMDDMVAFLDEVKTGADLHKDHRRELCDICNPPFEGKGAENLVKKLGLDNE